MTAVPLTPKLLHRQVAKVLHRRPETSVVAVHAPMPWTGPPEISVADRAWRVVWCGSTLAVRGELAAADDGGGPVVILTDRSDNELGADVVARLPRLRIETVNPWNLLAEAFSATRVDPRLTREDWLAEALLEALGSQKVAPARMGFLDFDTAWRAYLDRGVGLPEGRTDLETLLSWSRSLDAARLSDLPEVTRDGVLRYLAEQAGAAARAIGYLASRGEADRAVPLGLASRALFAEAPEAQRLQGKAQTRLEAPLGHETLDSAAGLAWARAAEKLVDQKPSDEGMELRRRGDDELEGLKALDLAYLSTALPAGLEGRCDRLATSIRAALEASRPGAAPVEQAAEELGAHQLCRPARARAAAMAARLVRWLGTKPSPGGGFLEVAGGYIEHEAFVDWARTAVHGAESSAGLGAAYQELLARVTERREETNRRFGGRLTDWFTSGGADDRLLPLESVLSTIVAPLAHQRRVLLLVVDGLSLGAYHEVVEDLAQIGWLELQSAAVGRRLHGLSPLPSVTSVCRTTLLTGELQTGTAAKEAKGFGTHGPLRQASTHGNKPRLFHKAQLRDDAGAGLDTEVQAAIENEQQRVVGVVVNAVDDYLEKSEQLAERWTLDTIRPLQALFDAASTAERVVIITADHGHVPERGLSHEGEKGGGARYRPVGGPLRDGEVLVAGPRVVTKTNEVVVPWTERLRYTARKSGYHGGASPQEMVVPIGVFTEDPDPPKGWQRVARYVPPWWEAAGQAATPKATTTPKKTAAQPKATDDQMDLFGAPAADAPPAWLETLLSTEVYKDQRSSAGRAAPSDELVVEILVPLMEKGGTATLLALSQATGKDQARTRSLVAAVQRVVNIDGYQVLDLDAASGTVKFDQTLAATQFGVP